MNNLSNSIEYNFIFWKICVLCLRHWKNNTIFNSCFHYSNNNQKEKMYSSCFSFNIINFVDMGFCSDDYIHLSLYGKYEIISCNFHD